MKNVETVDKKNIISSLLHTIAHLLSFFLNSPKQVTKNKKQTIEKP